MPLTREMKFRCDDTLPRRLEILAVAERRSTSDLARIILEDWCAEREKAQALRDANANQNSRTDAAAKLVFYRKRRPKNRTARHA